MSRFSCEQKTRAKQQSVYGNQSNVDGLRQHGLIHQTPAAATAGHHARRACKETLRTMLIHRGALAAPILRSIAPLR